MTPAADIRAIASGLRRAADDSGPAGWYAAGLLSADLTNLAAEIAEVTGADLSELPAYHLIDDDARELAWWAECLARSAALGSWPAVLDVAGHLREVADDMDEEIGHSLVALNFGGCADA